jgi:hypothetical protein
MEAVDPDAGPTSREQKAACRRLTALEKEFLKGVEEVKNNLLMNTKSYEHGLHYARVATMMFKRAINKPNEK